jgi:hypothetical protein
VAALRWARRAGWPPNSKASFRKPCAKPVGEALRIDDIDKPAISTSETPAISATEAPAAGTP